MELNWEVRLMKCALLAFATCGIALAGCDAGEGIHLGEVQTLAADGASNPTVAADLEGGFYVAWVVHGAQGGDVYLRRVAADGSVEEGRVRVNDLSGDADPHEQAPAQVAVAPDGDVFVVWQRTVEAPWLDFGGADLRLARSTDGGRTFEPAITVNDNPAGSPARISFHNVAVAADGTVHVSWIDARVRDYAREVAYRGGPQDPHAAHAEPGTEMRIAASHDDGRTFSPSRVVDGDTCPCCRTTMGLGAQGEIYVAWRKIFDGGIRDIAVARSTDGGATFSTPTAVHPDGWEFPGCPHAGPSLAVGGDGVLHATWYTGKEGRQGLWYAASPDGGATFGEPLAVLTDTWVPPSQARLALDGEDVWVAWDDLRLPEHRVGLARMEDGRLAEVEVRAVGRSPQLAFGPSGGLLVWHDGQAVKAVALGR